MTLRHVGIVLSISLGVFLLASLGVIGLAHRNAIPMPEPETTDPAAYDLGMWAYRNGEYELALSYLQRVPRDHPDYAHAMRMIGYNIYVRRMDKPEHGLEYVNTSLRRNPFNGNVWQDFYRIYLETAFDVKL